MKEGANCYLRPDGILMLEIAPFQFVNEISAVALGMISPSLSALIKAGMA